MSEYVAPRRQLTSLSALTVAVGILFIFFVTADWIAFSKGRWDMNAQLAKLGVSIICFLMAWLSVRQKIDRMDYLFLTSAFFFIVQGDILLTVNQFFPEPQPGDRALADLKTFMVISGVSSFKVCQIALILRHIRAFRVIRAVKETGERVKGSYRGIILTASLIYFSILTAALISAYYLRLSVLIVPVLIYVLVLITSLWMGLETLRSDFYPVANRWFIAVGLSCFFICDISVGINSLNLPISSVSQCITWIFYTPALVLIAYSGYR